MSRPGTPQNDLGRIRAELEFIIAAVTIAEKILPAGTDLDLRSDRSLAKLEPYMEVRNIFRTRYSEHFGNTLAYGDYHLPGRIITSGGPGECCRACSVGPDSPPLKITALVTLSSSKDQLLLHSLYNISWLLYTLAVKIISIAAVGGRLVA